jgi:DNA repair ATPase RecN
MLKQITLDDVGPARHMEVNFADWLTVLTGDNSPFSTLR